MSSMQRILKTLYQRAEPHLTVDDLTTLSAATDYAKNMALEARDVFMGIGCLVQSDESTGTFTADDDVPSLCFLAANTFDTVFGLLEMGQDAKYRLSLREEKKD